MRRPDICCFELHHQILTALQDFKSAIGIAPVVLSLDHHTDVLKAYSHARSQGRFKEPSTINEALALLRHDEHFDYAVNNNLASHVRIISHTSSNIEHDPRIVVSSGETLAETLSLNSPQARRLFDRALEDEFLYAKLGDWIPDIPYVLDIDLDYFKTLRSLNPKSSRLFQNLAANAGLITISMERDWVKILGFDIADSDEVLIRLKSLLPQ